MLLNFGLQVNVSCILRSSTRLFSAFFPNQTVHQPHFIFCWKSWSSDNINTSYRTSWRELREAIVGCYWAPLLSLILSMRKRNFTGSDEWRKKLNHKMARGIGRRQLSGFSLTFPAGNQTHWAMPLIAVTIQRVLQQLYSWLIVTICCYYIVEECINIR